MKANTLMTLATIVLSLSMISCAKGSNNSSTRVASTPASTSTVGTSCGTNMLNSQYGCLPQCGVSAVYYQNQCVQVTSTTGNNNWPGGQNNQGAAMCSGQCGAGATQVQGQCLPQNSCEPCYGYYQGYCYMGDFAHQYYGY